MASTGAVGVREGQKSGSLEAFDRRVLVVAVVAFVVMMALSGMYGYDRDELYFFDAARHLQGGYVDQPDRGSASGPGLV